MNTYEESSINIRDTTIRLDGVADEIDPDKHVMFTCPFSHFFNGPDLKLKTSSLLIKVIFRPSVVFWTHEEQARFFAAKNQEERWYWFSN